MDTPYRMKKTLREIAATFPENKVLLGLNLTQANEFVREGKAIDILNSIPIEKGEFILILYPQIGTI
jgi:16S rRNA (cytidine1402-2'-O)-methyltransferase